MVDPKDNDFGFTFIDESEIDSQIEDVESNYLSVLKKIEDLMLPFLQNLGKDPDKVMIKWPNRKEVIDRHIEKLTRLTRYKI